jgi:hypothetical protein
MTEQEQLEWIKAMIELVNDLPIGCEAMEPYIDSDNIHSEWAKFKESIYKK